MRSDDLVPLLAPSRGNVVGFRQGVIVSWNPNTAENLVLVGDSLMENLPILNTSEASILAVNDVVGILTAGPTWGILGRFTIPGTGEAVSALSSLRTQSADIFDRESVTATSMVDLATIGPEVTINVGPSGRLLVIYSCFAEYEVPFGSAINTSGLYMGAAMSGANVLAAQELRSLYGAVRYDSNQAGGFDTNIEINSSYSKVILYEDLNPGDTTFTAKYRRDTNGTVFASNRNITVMAI